MNQHFRNRIAALCLIGLPLTVMTTRPVAALAQERPVQAPNRQEPPPTSRVFIERAVSLELTPRGEATLAGHLEGIVENLGVSLREGFFPEFKYASKEPLSLDELAQKNPETGALLATVRSVLQDWFVGLEINNPRPVVQITNGSYQLSFARLAIVTDRAAKRRLRKTSGAVLALEISIDKIETHAERFLVADLDNQFLGVAGFRDSTVKNGAGTRIDMRIPFYIDISAKGQVKIEGLAATSNFQKAALQLDYKELITPNISIEINGKKFPLNKSHLEKTLQERKAALLGQLQAFLDKMATTQLAEVVTKEAAKLPATISQVNRMRPPGADEHSPDPDFLWGLEMRRLDLGDRRLAFGFSGWVEDPLKPGHPLEPNSTASAAFDPSGVADTSFDIALSINRGLINRILQLSYLRGYFAEIPIGEGARLKMFAPPQVQSPANASEKEPVAQPRVRIRVGIAQPISGLQRLLLQKEVMASVDVLARLQQKEGDEGLSLVLDSIDASTLDVPRENFTTVGLLFQEMVINKVKDELAKTSAGWKSKEQAIPGKLPLPPQFLGLKTVVEAMKMDADGYLVMFLNFEEKAK